MMRPIALSIALLSAGALAGCETPTSQRYSISVENNMAIQRLGATGVTIGTFSEPVTFEAMCRLVGPLRAPDGMTHTQYIQRAFDSEFKLASRGGTGAAPRVVLSGGVTRLAFATFSPGARDYWAIDLTLRSSNGKSLDTQVRYPFDSGYLGQEACRQAAEAFPRAVQDLIANTLQHSQFANLLR